MLATDGGRFITLSPCFHKKPETGKQNVGMYRMQVYDGKTTGMHWHIHNTEQGIMRIQKAMGK